MGKRKENKAMDGSELAKVGVGWAIPYYLKENVKKYSEETGVRSNEIASAGLAVFLMLPRQMQNGLVLSAMKNIHLAEVDLLKRICREFEKRIENYFETEA